jgi:Protein of unknown function (DUF1573)
MLKFCLTTTLLFSLQLLVAQGLSNIDNSLNAGKVQWIQNQINTGTVPFGIPVSREFEVKNISTENLMILQVKSSCFCTVAEWPKEPIGPGNTAKIKVTYDSQREGEFYRIVTVLTNFDTNQSVPLALRGKVTAQN